MRFFYASAVLILTVTTALASDPAKLLAPNATVGGQLQTSVSIRLTEAAPEKGLEITLRSLAGSKLLLSKAPDQAGAATLRLQVRPGFKESPEFWIQALSDTGVATYTAEAPAYVSGAGEVTLTFSAMAIMGPFKGAGFTTTTKGAPTAITLKVGRLDDKLAFVEEQALAGGTKVSPDVISSHPNVGRIISKDTVLVGGTSSEMLGFGPGVEGEAILSLAPLPGFHTALDFASVKVVVRQPGLAVSDELLIGRNLQVAGVLSLGAASPEEGVTVTIESSDPKRMLISPSSTEIGSSAVKVKIGAGGASGQYYLQAIGDSGTVTYTASADGYRSRTATVALTPSGILLTPIAQGPPDEAHVLRMVPPEATHRFATSLSHGKPTQLMAWTAQLDPKTLRGADITVQPLRAGMTISVPVTNSNPGVGEIARSVTIKGGFDHGQVDFTPRSEGSSEIEVANPEFFTKPTNATKVIVIVSN